MFLAAVNAQAQSSNIKASDHAPIGVMRDHVHRQGEFMASYRFSYMAMQGLAQGDDKLSMEEALQDYMMSPKEMVVKMHMLGVMYGVTDKFTLSAMTSFVEKDMQNIHKITGNFKRETSDLSDSKVNTIYQFYNDNQNRLQFNLGLSLPSGNINKKHNGQRLAYAMQIGSGSYELLPGLSFSGHSANISYGAQINGNFKINHNDNGYKFGDSYNFTSWLARDLSNSLSISSRLDYTKSEAIEGNDISLNNMMMAGNNITKYDKEQLDLLLGSNFIFTQDSLKGHRIALELGMPIYQRVDGPILESDFKIIAGWQKLF